MRCGHLPSPNPSLKMPPGDRFGRKKMMAMGVALGSDPVVVRLTDDQSAVSWKSVDAPTFGSVKVG